MNREPRKAVASVRDGDKKKLQASAKKPSGMVTPKKAAVQQVHNTTLDDIMDEMNKTYVNEKKRDGKKGGVNYESDDNAPCSSKQLPDTPVPSVYNRVLTRMEVMRYEDNENMVKVFLHKEGLMERILGYKMLRGKVDHYSVVRATINIDDCLSVPCEIIEGCAQPKVRSSSRTLCLESPEETPISPTQANSMVQRGPKTPPGSPHLSSKSSSPALLAINEEEELSPRKVPKDRCSPLPPPPLFPDLLPEEGTNEKEDEKSSILREMSRVTNIPTNMVEEFIGEDLQHAMGKVDRSVLLSTLKNALKKVTGKGGVNMASVKASKCSSTFLPTESNLRQESADNSVGGCEMDISSNQSDDGDKSNAEGYAYDSPLLPPPPMAPRPLSPPPPQPASSSSELAYGSSLPACGQSPVVPAQMPAASAGYFIPPGTSMPGGTTTMFIPFPVHVMPIPYMFHPKHNGGGRKRGNHRTKGGIANKTWNKTVPSVDFELIKSRPPPPVPEIVKRESQRSLEMSAENNESNPVPFKQAKFESHASSLLSTSGSMPPPMMYPSPVPDMSLPPPCFPPSSFIRSNQPPAVPSADVAASSSRILPNFSRPPPNLMQFSLASNRPPPHFLESNSAERFSSPSTEVPPLKEDSYKRSYPQESVEGAHYKFSNRAPSILENECVGTPKKEAPSERHIFKAMMSALSFSNDQPQGVQQLAPINMPIHEQSPSSQQRFNWPQVYNRKGPTKREQASDGRRLPNLMDLEIPFPPPPLDR